MELMLVFLVFLVLYYFYALWFGKRSLQKGIFKEEIKNKPFRTYMLVSLFAIPIAYFLIFGFGMLVGWIVDESILKLREDYEVAALISFILAVIIPTMGIFPIKLVYFLLYHKNPHIFDEEKYTSNAKFFSLQGRIGGMKYLTGIIATYIGIPIVWIFFVVIISTLSFSSYLQGILLFFITILLATILICLNTILAVKRVHDLDRPRKHAWLLLVPFYNFYFGLMLNYQKGSFGNNRFGPDPKVYTFTVDEFKKSFDDIDINRCNYIIIFSYLDEEKALEDYEKLKKMISDYNEKIKIQLRKYSDNTQLEAMIVFFCENPLEFDALVTWLGDGDYSRGRKLISSDVQNDYSNFEGYERLYSISKRGPV